MPDSQTRVFTKYDAMSTEELQQILREDASKPTGKETDTDALFYIMEVLAKRRTDGKAPEEALKSFKENYSPESAPAKAKQPSTHRRTGGAIAAAVLLIFIIGGSFTARAMGLDLWEIITRWTQETLHLGYSREVDDKFDPTPDYIDPCASLQAAVDDFNITTALVPTWIPDGYAEVNVETEETPLQKRIIAKYQSGESNLYIKIVDYLSEAPAQVEQSDPLIEMYPSNNIDYYIFNNYEELKAVWISGEYECHIIGPLTVSEMEKMIDSIEKG